MNPPFDRRDNLKPYQITACDLSTLEKTFVLAFPSSLNRNRLWNNYLKFIADIQRDISPHFTQWIDGSFCTNRSNPYDIDVVTFIDHDIFQQKEAILVF